MKLICLFFFFVIIGVEAKELLSISDIDLYLREQEHFFKSFCQPGEEQRYQRLLDDYRGAGFFLPTLNNDKEIDTEAIRKNIPLMEKKIKWIDSEINKLQKSSMPKFSDLSWPILSTLEELLSLKQNYYQQFDSKMKLELRKKSRDKLEEFQNHFKKIVESISFLHNMDFPVSHLDQRKDYDELREGVSRQEEINKNAVYLKRKIYEDGAFSKKRKVGDKNIRALLSSLAINIVNSEDLLTENIRYDLEDFMTYLKDVLSTSKTEYIDRLIEWKSRSVEFANFYKKLLSEANSKNYDEKKHLESLIYSKSNTRFLLNDFTLNKLAEVYSYWSSKSELLRKLFVIETILYNEVGTVDGDDALERKAVTQVILNRHKDILYNQLPKSDPIYERLSSDMKIKSSSLYWLNVLFKQGEFSFTYSFIPGSVKIYCPDMSRSGRLLRRKNLLVAKEIIDAPRWDFHAVRYFSRASMFGRIDMSLLWSGFRPLSEEPGLPIKNQAYVKKIFNKGQFRYLYTFENSDNRIFDVIEVKNQVLVKEASYRGIVFYKYRNPHYFKYFQAY